MMMTADSLIVAVLSWAQAVWEALAGEASAVSAEALSEAEAPAGDSNMTRQEFFDGLENAYGKCLSIVRAKNADYAKGDNPFRNFEYSKLLDIPPQEAMMVRTLDKLARISNLMQKRKDGQDGEVQDERMEDTILDAINYLGILYVYLNKESYELSEDKEDSSVHADAGTGTVHA